MTTTTTPRHRRPRPSLTAKVGPVVTSRKGLVLTGSILSLPAMASSLVQATPAQADPGTGGSGSGSSGVSANRASASVASASRASASYAATPQARQVVYLRYGSTGSYVRIAQQRLGGLELDGYFGPVTQAKVKKFQASKRLAADGIIGPRTWQALGGFPGTTPQPPTPRPQPPSCSVSQIRYGSSGQLVSIAQQRLGGLVVDGQFGAATLNRVKSFQSGKGLVADGIVGVATWAALGGYPCGTPPVKPPKVDPPPAGQGLAAVIPIARKYFGVPYVWGGSSPSQGFDCSGLTSYVYRQAGLSIPRTASQQQRAMKSTSNPQPGDLVFFGYPAYHVGIYVGNNQMIAAPKPGDVVKQQPIYTTPSGYGTLR